MPTKVFVNAPPSLRAIWDGSAAHAENVYLVYEDQRITFTEGRPIQREPILTELRQRIRDVRQGPDGLLYALTDEDNGVVLRIEPASAAPSR